MKTIFATTTALILAACAPVYAQQQCGPRDAVVGHLNNNFTEIVHVRGLDTRGNMVEVYGNEETGSWTLTYTRPDQVTCLITHGEGFTVVDEELPPAGEDS